MEVFGIIGMSFCTMGFIFVSTMARISKLENQLKETGVLDEGFKSE